MRHPNPFYVGSIAYMERILGNRLAMWFLPITAYKQYGYEFPMLPEPTIYDLVSERVKKQVQEEERELDGDKYLADVEKKYKPQQVIYHNLILLNNLPLPPGFVVAKPYVSHKHKEDDS